MREWIHLGDDDSYIAINQAKQSDLKADNNYNRIGINHLGFVVQDVQEIANNLLSNGYKRDYPKQVEQFRVRDYFADADGNQYEFVQYLIEVLQKKTVTTTKPTIIKNLKVLIVKSYFISIRD